jgi:hypothetical protein
MFFSSFEYHVFYVLYPLVTYLLILTRTTATIALYGTVCSESLTGLHFKDFEKHEKIKQH